MSEPYVGEIRMFGGNFAPAGWMFCDGSVLPISENDTLFNLIGTTYGGDGQNTFALPDLRGRVPIHQGTKPGGGSSYAPGQLGGVPAVTLTGNQMPVHTHAFSAQGGSGSQPSPVGNAPATSNVVSIYKAATPGAAFDPSAMPGTVGGGQPHDNMQPYLCVNFIISLYGIYPSPT